MGHTHYDEQDLPALKAVEQHVLAAIGAVNMREDASIFAARELDYVKAQVYERKFPEMMGLTLVPTSSDAPEWAETITYTYYDEVGMAKIIANYADDLPRADVAGQEKTVRVKVIGDSYGYNFRELAASLATGKNLPQRKAMAARRAIDIKLNSIAMIGDDSHGLFGLVSHPNIGMTTLPSGKNWATGNPTPQELIKDVNAMYDAVRIQSKGVHKPNKMLLATSRLNILKRTLVPDSGGKSVLALLKENFDGVEFVEVPELDSQSSTIMFMGEFDESNINHELPMPFMQHPAEQRNLEIVINCTASSAGVIVYYPLAFTKGNA